jgi:uncharacterized membrane protein YfcA
MLLAAADVAPWLLILCLSAAMLIIGIGKAGFGVGVGIVATPLIALVVSPNPRVLALSMPALLLGDLCGLACHRRDYEWPLLRQLIPAGIVGVVLGAATFKLMQLHYADQQAALNDAFGLAIGTVCLVIIAMQSWRLAGGRTPLLPIGPGTTLFVGVFEAFLSTLTNSAGVLMALLLLRKQLSKQHFVTTVLIYFAIVNSGKIIAYIFVNENMTWDTVREGAPFLPLVALGAWLGRRLNHRMDAKTFTFILYAIAAVTAARMIQRVALG